MIEKLLDDKQIKNLDTLCLVYEKYGNLSAAQRAMVLNDPRVKNAPRRLLGIWHYTNRHYGMTGHVYYITRVARMLGVDEEIFFEDWVEKYGKRGVDWSFNRPKEKPSEVHTMLSEEFVRRLFLIHERETKKTECTGFLLMMNGVIEKYAKSSST